VVASVVRSDAGWVLIATALMMASMFLRAVSWFAIARAALPRSPLRRRDVTSATMIGVLMSATLPARLGEPARAMVLSRRTGRMRETFPVLLGTLVSQTALNIVALALLGVIIVASTDLFHRSSTQLFVFSLAPLVVLLAVVLAPVVVRQRNAGGRLGRIVRAVREALLRVRTGLQVFRDPRRGSVAAAAQLGAWGIQLLACAALFEALGLHGGIGAAAAVLFAVNVTAVVPATPSNIGVFQLAVISVLTTGFGVGAADALAYGVILQAVEIATAVALGLPALVREGLTWSDMRLRALSAAPVRLSPRPGAETVSS
jgi:phosphatidylinositol alpha-mannosyltransferase